MCSSSFDIHRLAPVAADVTGPLPPFGGTHCPLSAVNVRLKIVGRNRGSSGSALRDNLALQSEERPLLQRSLAVMESIRIAHFALYLFGSTSRDRGVIGLLMAG